MSHPHPGSLATYNSLTDKHLAGYFSNTRIRRHLQRSGLISRSGRIISEKEYQLNAMRKDHQKYVRECLAQAIFHKVLDMERHHQLEIKRKLEHFVRKERVQRIKVERSRRSVEDINPLLSPHPPAGPRSHYGRHTLIDGEQSGPSQSSSSPRPNTAPGNMQRPVRLQPLLGYPTAGSTPKTSSRSKQKLLELESGHQFPNGGDKSMMRFMNSLDYSTGISPYQLPIINNYVIPVPPPAQKGDKNIKGVRHGTARGRHFRPTTAPNGLEQLLTKDSGKFHKPSLHSNASVTLIYLGKSVHLSHDDSDYRDEIKVYQQHCGGENLCVYKGKLLEGETFQFTSKRHHGFPFSLTFFLNGIQVDRLSSCCEYKHRKGARLGGKHGYFGFVNVDRASPCYRCIIAMGLDKKPSPPKRKIKEDNGEKQEDSAKDEERNAPSESSTEQEATKHLTAEISSAHGEGQEPAEDNVEMGEEEREEETQEGPEDEYEGDQETASKDEYEEDFEGDEEKSDEKVNEERQADDQMNGMSKSPSDDEKDNLDHEKESKNSSQKALQASDSEKDESDGYSNSDSEEDKQDRKSASSLSSSSALYSCEDDPEAEKMKDTVQDKEKEDIERTATCEKHGNETWEGKRLKTEENQEICAVEEEEMDEAEETKVEGLMREEVKSLHGTVMEAHHQSADELNEGLKYVGSIEHNAGEEGKKDGSNMREDGEEVVLVHLEGNTGETEATNQESPEVDGGGDCKSVQEKIAEAIENDHHLSSEPEPSDSSTDEEEENLMSTAHDIKEDGAFLADVARALEKQKAAEQVIQEGQMVDEKKALEAEEEFVAVEEATATEETSNETILEIDVLAKKETAAVMEQTVENVVAVNEEASEEKTIVDDLEESAIGKEMVFKGEEASKRNVALEEEVNKGDEAVEKAAHEGREAEEISPEGEEIVEEMFEGDMTVEKAAFEAEGIAETRGNKDVGELASEAEEAVEKADSEGKEMAEEAVEKADSEGKEMVEEAVEKADSEGKEMAEEAVEKADSEGKEMAEEAVEKADSEGKEMAEEAVEKADSEGKEIVEKAVEKADSEGKEMAEEAMEKADSEGKEMAEKATEKADSEGKEMAEKAMEKADSEGKEMAEKAMEKADSEGKEMAEEAVKKADSEGKEMVEEAVEKADSEGKEMAEKAMEKADSEGKEMAEEAMEKADSEGKEMAEEAMEKADSGGKEMAEEAMEKADSEGKEMAEKAMEKADSEGKEAAEGIDLEGEEVVEEGACEALETVGEAEFVVEASREAVLLLGAATEREESVEPRRAFISDAVPEGEAVAAAAEELSEQMKDAMETNPEEGGTKEGATEEASVAEESPAVGEDAPQGRERKRAIAIEAARKGGESTARVPEEEDRADRESEEEGRDEETHRVESVAEGTAREGDEVMKAEKEELTEEAEEQMASQAAAPGQTLLIGGKVPVDEEAIDKATVRIEAAEGEAVGWAVAAEGVVAEDMEVAECVAVERDVVAARESAEGGQTSETARVEESMSEEAVCNGEVMGSETPPQGEEIEKSEPGEKENAAEVLSDGGVETDEAGQEGQEEEEADSREQKVMTEEMMPKEGLRPERTSPDVEKLVTLASLGDEVEAGEAALEGGGVRQEMAGPRDVVEKEAVLVEEMVATVRHTDGNDKTEERGTETVEEKITLQQLDTSEKIRRGKPEALVEYPQGIPGSTDLLKTQHKEGCPALLRTDTTGASVTEGGK